MKSIRLIATKSLRSWMLLALVALLSACSLSPELRTADLARIEGKTYVVTGASSGFGRGVAERLGTARANVVLAARRTELLEEVAGRVRAAGGQALVVTTDVARPGDMDRLMSAALARFGRVDVWINNAGVGAIGRFEDIPVEDHSRLVDVNLKGVIHGSHLALRQFRKQGSGTLVNIGSVESEVPLAYQASYAATKAAVLSLGRTLNEELRLARLADVQVVTVMPWAADTPFFAHAGNYSGRQPNMVLLDPPEKVVDAIVWVSVNPREELPVGWKAGVSTANHRLFPDLTERASADLSQKAQMEEPPPAPSGPGSIHRPVQEGRSISGGMRHAR
ncbi:Short-chain dehydrogenase [Burkholderiales bacterium 8X]|nr:Short-chain dehydrogenase [Burkholderiales bacterium 8X]